MREVARRCPTVVVGIDQTGAARRKGMAAAPLPAVVVRRSGLSWRVARVGRLSSLTPQALAAWDVPCGPQTWLAVDACLGLPAAAAAHGQGEEALWAWFRAAAAWEHDGKRFGRAVAAAFFAALGGGSSECRAIDRQTGALSVLRTTPYQRNIQTGSHRIWRDVGSVPGEPWAAVWPFVPTDQGRDRPWLHEVYPSWGWRTLLREPVRRPDKLPGRLRALGWELPAEAAHKLAADGDLADAAVAALVGVHASAEGRARLLPPTALREGWILGVEPAAAGVPTTEST